MGEGGGGAFEIILQSELGTFRDISMQPLFINARNLGIFFSCNRKATGLCFPMKIPENLDKNSRTIFGDDL